MSKPQKVSKPQWQRAIEIEARAKGYGVEFTLLNPGQNPASQDDPVEKIAADVRSIKTTSDWAMIIGGLPAAFILWVIYKAVTG